MSVSLFGRELETFSTVDRAFPTLFIALLGEYDYDELDVAGRAFTFVFFFGFLGVLQLVMLSMLIGVIIDHYVEVKERATQSEPIWSDAFNILRRAWQNHQKSRVCLTKIRAQLSKECQVVMSVDAMLDRVPGLKDKQARRLLMGAVNHWRARHREPVDVSHLREFVWDVVHTLKPYVPESEQVARLSTASAADLAADRAAAEAAVEAQSSAPAAEGEASAAAACSRQDLSNVSLRCWLEIAAIRLEKGQDVPEFHNSVQHLKGLLESARCMTDDITLEDVASI